jgi:hypothetical protein
MWSDRPWVRFLFAALAVVVLVAFLFSTFRFPL